MGQGVGEGLHLGLVEVARPALVVPDPLLVHPGAKGDDLGGDQAQRSRGTRETWVHEQF
jgi:hypothetical protein